jgi:hypothetical protein
VRRFDDRGKAKNSGAEGAHQSPATVRYLVAVALGATPRAPEDECGVGWMNVGGLGGIGMNVDPYLFVVGALPSVLAL